VPTSAAPRSYRIGGLVVSSQLDLPGAIEVPANDDNVDVTVRFEPVPEALGDGIVGGPNWYLDGDTLLLRVPRLARYLISDGLHIGVELEPGATERDASAFVLGTSFGILLHQRGALVLHGAAVAKDGAAFVVCGRSGEGKSTLAAALCRAGFDVVADDICVIDFAADRRPVVAPDGRQLKLWRESIDKLDLAGQQGEAVREGLEKYFMAPAADAAATAPPRLTAIYVLRGQLPPLGQGIEPLALPDAMRMLDIEAYRPGLRARIGSKRAMLGQGVAMLAHAKVFRLIRPRGFEHMDATVAQLTAHWESLRP
jgi:hypothetical protein